MVDRIPLRAMAHSLGTVPIGEPIVRPPEAVPVQAWVATRDGDELVNGEAVAWSPRAVRLHYFDRHGREGYAWVWVSAVTRR